MEGGKSDGDGVAVDAAAVTALTSTTGTCVIGVSPSPGGAAEFEVAPTGGAGAGALGSACWSPPVFLSSSSPSWPSFSARNLKHGAQDAPTESRWGMCGGPWRKRAGFRDGELSRASDAAAAVHALMMMPS